MEKSILVNYILNGDRTKDEKVREFSTIRSCRDWFRINSKLIDMFSLEILFDGELHCETEFFRFRSVSQSMKIVSLSVRDARIAYINSLYII